MLFFNQKKSQVSLEYLMLLCFVFLLFVPLLVYYQNETANPIRYSLADDAVKSIAKTADIVHALGPGNQRIIRVFLPTGIINQTIAHNEAMYVMRYRGELTEMHYPSKAELLGELPLTPGFYNIYIKANNNGSVTILPLAVVKQGGG